MPCTCRGPTIEPHPRLCSRDARLVAFVSRALLGQLFTTRDQVLLEPSSCLRVGKNKARKNCEAKYRYTKVRITTLYQVLQPARLITYYCIIHYYRNTERYVGMSIHAVLYSSPVSQRVEHAKRNRTKLPLQNYLSLPLRYDIHTHQYTPSIYTESLYEHTGGTPFFYTHAWGGGGAAN